MLEKHWTRMSLAVAATLFAATACSKGDNAGGDTATDSGSVSAANTAPAADRVDPSMVMAFLHTVDQGEVEAGRVAQTKATNAQVKEYARMMVTDHCKSLTMAASANAGGPTPAGAAGTTGSSATKTSGSSSSGSTAECDRAMGTSGTAGTTGTPATTSAPAGSSSQNADIQQLQQQHQQDMSTLQSTAKGAKFDSTYIAAMVNGHQQVLQRLESMNGSGGSASGSASGSAAGGATPSTGAAANPGTGSPGAAGSPGTTQPSSTANQGDATQSHLQNAITMVRTHLEKAQDIQKKLQGNGR